MLELWYEIIMSLSGILTLFGIIITWLIFRRIETIVGEEKHPSGLLLIGGLMTSGGFSGAVLSKHPVNGILAVLILTGPALIAYSLAMDNVVKVSGRLMLQAIVTLSSLIFAGNYSTVMVDVIYVGPFLALLLLMNSLISLKFLDEVREKLLIISSWFVVMFSWTRYWLDNTTGIQKGIIVAFFAIPIVLWVIIATSIYLSIPKEYPQLDKNDQEIF